MCFKLNEIKHPLKCYLSHNNNYLYILIIQIIVKYIIKTIKFKGNKNDNIKKRVALNLRKDIYCIDL